MMNKITSESQLADLVMSDDWMMSVLRAAQELNLPDWWIGAGFLRNKVWDFIESNVFEPTKDVDLVYFDISNKTPEADWVYDEQMKQRFPMSEWEVRNQARMHYVNNFEPYHSTEDGIAHWVETATCVAVRLEGDELHFLFCHGTDDLFNLIARPIENFRSPELLPTFINRVESKRWRQKWPHLRVEMS